MPVSSRALLPAGGGGVLPPAVISEAASFQDLGSLGRRPLQLGLRFLDHRLKSLG